MTEQKEVLYSRSDLEQAVEIHGYPVTIEVAGTGTTYPVQTASELCDVAQKAFDVSLIVGNGLVIL